MADHKADPFLMAAPVSGVSPPPSESTIGYMPPIITTSQMGTYEPSPGVYAPANPQCCSNGGVVTTQPCSRNANKVVYSTRDHFFMVSFLATICCCLTGVWSSLLCTVPGIVYASAAQDAELRGDIEGVRKNGRIAMYLNIAALVNFSAMWLIAIIVAIAKSV